MTDPLGRFNHHPDPAIDFCVEVEDLEGMAYNRRVGFDAEPDLDRRIERAMRFRVGGDQNAIAAKDVLREIERKVQSPLTDTTTEIRALEPAAIAAAAKAVDNVIFAAGFNGPVLARQAAHAAVRAYLDALSAAPQPQGDVAGLVERIEDAIYRAGPEGTTRPELLDEIEDIIKRALSLPHSDGAVAEPVAWSWTLRLPMGSFAETDDGDIKPVHRTKRCLTAFKPDATDPSVSDVRGLVYASPSINPVPAGGGFDSPEDEALYHIASQAFWQQKQVKGPYSATKHCISAAARAVRSALILRQAPDAGDGT